MSSSTKSRERKFRHRRGGGDDDDDDKSSINTSSPRTKATPSTSSTNKPKKPILSFVEDDEIEDSPFSRPPIKSTTTSSSSSRLSSKSTSAHKLISSKDRTPRPPSSSLPSNVQPQAGLYTKEALLELQKNTRSIAGSSRLKPKEVETVVVLKGLVKPVSVLSSNEVETNGETRDSEEVEKDDGLVMDQMAIDAIRAKRERLRKAKPAAQDFISLDGGSNHGEAEGLSDEESEFRGRIGLFGEKVGGADKKGVFEAFEEMVMSKEVKVDSLDEDDDDEEKMWEEEQVRKGLGKRLDDGIGSHGGSVGVSGGSGRVSGPSNFGVTGVYGPSQDVAAGGSSGIGGLFGEEDVMPIAQHAELAEKALHENLRRAKETYDRTLSALTRTEENLSSSLVNITSLETSFVVADNKFVFMQKLGDFVAVICEFLKHKAPFIEELEEQIQNLHEERARAIAERRAADNSDELSEIEPAIIAARVEFQKRGSSAASVAAATAAAQAASTNASMSKSTQVELDEFGRDVNLQKRMDATRRAEARRRRRDKADNKRKLAMDNDNSFQQMEGELSTDESDSEHTAYESTRNELLQVADNVLSDATEEFSQFHVVIGRFDRFKKDYASSYHDAYMSLSIPTIFSPYVRLELLKWDPLHQDADFIDMKWHSLLFDYGIREDESTMNGDDVDADANLIPDLVEKLAIPTLRHHLATCWDMLSTRETEFAVAAVKLIVRYVDLSSSELGTDLISVLHDRLSNAVADLVVPTWSPLEMNAVPSAGRVAAYRFGMSIRLLRNICLWKEILAMPVLEKISLDNLLCGKVLPHLHSIHSNVHDAISRSERVVASLNGVWTGPSATGDRSHNRKLQPLVDYLLSIGKTLKKRYASGAMDFENSKLVRRLKKMMVELNEYDHARALSKTFNLKEAL